MKGIGTILWFTIQQQLKKKSFVISTILLLLFTVLLSALPAIIQFFSEDATTPRDGTNGGGTLFVLDETELFFNQVAELEERFAAYYDQVEMASPDQLEQLRQDLETQEQNALLLIRSVESGIGLEYYLTTSKSGLAGSELEQIVRSIYQNKLLLQAGLSAEQVAQIPENLPYAIHEVGGGMGANLAVGILLSLFLFLSIYLFGYGVAMSVVSEKTSRVMELLLTSIHPAKIMVGKTIGMGLLGFCQFVLILLTGAISYTCFGAGGFSTLGLSLENTLFTPLSLITMIVYFVLGYFLYAFLNAVAGATVSKAEDVQSALKPVNLICVLAFYFAYFTLLMGASERMVTIVSMVPFSSPFSMPIRMLSGEVPPWQLLGSVTLLLGTVCLIAWISIRLYAKAVLHYGSKLSLSRLFRTRKLPGGSDDRS